MAFSTVCREKMKLSMAYLFRMAYSAIHHIKCNFSMAIICAIHHEILSLNGLFISYGLLHNSCVIAIAKQDGSNRPTDDQESIRDVVNEIDQ